MKISNLILSLLFAVILLVMVGSNLVLKAEFDKIDRTDVLSSYRKEVLPPFHYVKLDGKTFGVMQIQPGKTHEMRIIADPQYQTWKINGDTLHFTFLRDWEKNDIQKDWELRATPTFYVIAPDITEIISNDAIIKVSGWKTKNMSIKQTGGAVQFSDNQIENLHFNLISDVLGKVDASNSFGKATFDVRGQSTLNVEKNVFGAIEMNVDSAAIVSLPGSLLKTPR